MALLDWNNGGGDSLWSTPANWVGGVAPTPTDTVQFDATSVNDSIADIKVAGVDIQAGYTGIITVQGATALGNFSIANGTVSGGVNDFSVGSYTQSGGTFTATSAVLNIKGDWNKTGGTFNHNNGEVKIGTGGFIHQSMTNSAVEIFYTLRLDKGNFDFNVVTTKIQVSNRLIVDNGPTASGADLSGAIEMTGASKVEQNGNLLNGLLSFVGTNHEWIQNNTSTNAQMPAITINCTDLTLTVGTAGNTFGSWSWTWFAGTITNAATSIFKNNQQFKHAEFLLFQTLTIGGLESESGNFDFKINDQTGVGPATLQVNGNVKMTGVAGGTQYLGVGSTLALTGDYIQTGTASGMGELRLLFNGTGAQSIILGVGKGIPALTVEVDKSGGTLLLANDVTIDKATNNFTHTNGTLDLMGFNLEAGNDLTLNSTVNDLSGSIITVGGDFSAANTDLIAGAAWQLDVIGSNVITGGTVTNCDSLTSGKKDLRAFTSIDGGGNTGVLFSNTIPRYINTASTAGGNGRTNTTTGVNRAYATATEWEAAEQTDLVVAGTSHKVLCSGLLPDLSILFISGWATDSTYYITFESNPDTVDGRNFSRIYSSNHYRIESTIFNNMVTLGNLFTRVIGIQVTTDDINTESIRVNGASCIVDGCKIRGNVASSGQTGIILRFNSGGSCVKNCLVDGRGNGTFSGINSLSGVASYIYGNTIVNSSVGINGNTFAIAKNNLIYNCTASYTALPFNAASDYNSTDNAETTGGANDRQSQTFTFINSGSGDYGLTQSDLGAFNLGVDLSSDVNCPILIDNRNVARPQFSTYDIGAFESIFSTITRYINTASTAGGDGTTNAIAGANRAYASAIEWEAAEQTDLVASESQHHILCSGVVADVGWLIIQSWTTNVTNKVIFEANPNDIAGRNFNTNGIISTNHYRVDRVFAINSGGTMDCRAVDIDIVGIQVLMSGPGAFSAGIYPNIGAGKFITIDACIIDVSALTGATITWGILFEGYAGVCKNSVIYGSKNTAIALNGRGIDGSSDDKAFNNTLRDNGNHIQDLGEAKNNLMYNASSGVDITGTTVVDNNAGENPVGTNFITIIPADEVMNPVTGDVRLKTTAQSFDSGANLVADGIDYDLIGTSRPQGAAFDIGAFEYTDATRWVGLGATESALEAANWGRGLPSISNRALYSGINGGGDDKNSTLDISTILAAEVTGQYDGIITQSLDVYIADQLNIEASSLQDWVTNGFNLDVDGDYNISSNGKGLTQVGGTIRWGSDVSIIGSGFSKMKGAVKLFGGAINPTLVKSHIINDLANVLSDTAGTFEIGENQEMVLKSGESISGFILGVNSKVTTLVSLTIFITGIITPENCTWVGPNINSLQLYFLGANKLGADYGNCRIAIQEDSDINGNLITLGDIRFLTNNLTNVFTVFNLIQCRDMSLGGTNPLRATTVIQKSGSQFILSGDMLLRSDNGVEETKWTRESGVLDSVIGGDLTVEALAGLDFSGDNSQNDVFGVTSIDAASVADFGSTTLRHYGDIKNPTNANEFYNLITVPAAGVLLTDDVFIGNLWSFEGVGNFDWNGNKVEVNGDGAQLIGAELITFAPSLGSARLDMQLVNSNNGGLTTIPSAVYNVELLVRRSGGGLRTLQILGDVDFVRGILTGDMTVDLNGFELGCSTFASVFGPHVIALNGGFLNCTSDLTFKTGDSIVGAGTFECVNLKNNTGAIVEMSNISGTVSGAHTVSLGATFNLGNGTIEVFGDFIPLGDVIFGANSKYIIHGDFDISGANSVTYGSNSTLQFSGSNIQNITVGAFGGPSNVVIKKSGGTVKINQSMPSSILEFNATFGSATVEFDIAVSYSFNTLKTSGVTGNKTSIVSSVAATKVQLTFNSPLTPAAFYTGWKDTDVQNIIQVVDTNTGSDDGNNTLAGVNGLSFQAVALPFIGGRLAMGLGLGLGLGASHTHGN